jgi:hypothetical protein
VPGGRLQSKPTWLNAFWASNHVGFFSPLSKIGFEMIRFLGMLVLLSILVAGIGYYRGWFRAESQDTNGQGAITLTVDKNKLNQDKASAQQEVQDLRHK